MVVITATWQTTFERLYNNTKSIAKSKELTDKNASTTGNLE